MRNLVNDACFSLMLEVSGEMWASTGELSSREARESHNPICNKRLVYLLFISITDMVPVY
jgi:hypothetical protein